MFDLEELLKEYMLKYSKTPTFSTTRNFLPRPTGIWEVGDAGNPKWGNPISADEEFSGIENIRSETDNANYKYKKDYKSLYSEADWDSIVRKSAKWGKDPRAIAGIIWHESNGKTDAVNSMSKAAGLFQIMPSTAEGLGIDHSAITGMSFDDQLDLGEKYFKSYGKKWESASSVQDLYALVFYPAMYGKPDEYVLGASAGKSRVSKIAEQNSRYDLDKNNSITKGEVYAWGDEHFKRGGIMYRKK